MKKKIFFYFCFLQFFFSFLFAQEIFKNVDFLTESFKIDDVVIADTTTFSRKKIISLLGIKPGQIINAKDINDGFKSIFGFGAFTKISIEIEEVGSIRKLVVKVVDNLKIKKVFIVGNDFISTFSLKKEADVSKYYKKTNLEEVVEKIKIKYLADGFIDVAVSYQLTDQKDGKINVVFFVEEGNRYIMKNFIFHGNKNVKSSKIISRVAQKIESFLRKGLYEAEKVEQASDNIIFFYKTLGYIDVKINDIKYNFYWKNPEKRKEVYVTAEYFISEGEKYYFGGYEIRGNKFFAKERLMKVLRRKKGDVYNEQIYQRDIMNMYSVYRDNGYFFSRVTPIENIDRKNKTISHIFDIYEGSISHIEQIFIQGLTRTKEFVVRRALSIEEGEVFLTSSIRESILRLKHLEYFSSIYPNFSLGTLEGLLNLTFVFKERQTSEVSGGITYSSSTGISINLKFKESNFLGRGQNFSFVGSYGLTGKYVEIGFFEPWFLKFPFGMGAQFHLSKNYRKKFTDSGSPDIELPGSSNDIVNKHKNSIYFSRDIIKFKFLFSKSFLIWYNFQPSLFIESVRDHLQTYRFFPEKYTQKDIYERNKSLFSTAPPNFHLINYGFTLSLTRNTIDSSLNPTTGSSFGVFTEFYFGGYSLSRWSLNYSNFYTPLKIPFVFLNQNSSFVFGYSFQVSSLALSLLGDFKYPEQNYYGFHENPSVMRGWDYMQIYNFRGHRFGREGLVGQGDNVNGEPLGQAVINHLFEIHMPLPMDLFQFTMFFEMGSMSVKKINLRSENIAFLFDFKNMIYDAGVGFRLNVPMLPLRLYFSWRFVYDNVSHSLKSFGHRKDRNGVIVPEIIIDLAKKF